MRTRNFKEKFMPLMLAPPNRAVKIVKIVADEKTKKHLQNLGITIGAEITVFSSQSGSVICMVKSGKLALDRAVASHIFVA